ncbi:MAG: GDP-mannose 4,6-dehydratase, partial [Acidobacteriota bacterium]
YLITAMLRGDTVYLGMPESVRTYMHVDDHVAAYRAVIERPETAGEVFNISPGETVTNREVCLRLADLLDYDPERIVFGEYPPGYPNRPAPSDQPSIELDASKAHRELGWRPRVSLGDGLRRTVERWRAQLDKG